MNGNAESPHLPGVSAGFGGGTAKVLVVDDEADVRGTLSCWLKDDGYDCHTAACVEEAWKHLDGGDFSLLVSDVKMPGKWGMALLAMTKALLPDMAVLMVTDVSDRKMAVQAMELGAYGYIIKPCEKDEVAINVVNALERRRLVLESREYERRLEQSLRAQADELRSSREEISLRLVAAQEYRHDETGAHVRRIGLYAEMMGGRMGYRGEQAELLRLAAPMHDIGKIGIPDAVLQKPGCLDAEEWKVMKTHTTIGARILEGSNIPLLNLTAEIALTHHEKWDGSGYPEGLSGDTIPESARIVAVLDAYDALLHDRVYRLAMPEDDVLAWMTEQQGHRFSPKVFEVFMGALPELDRIRAEIKEKAHSGGAVGGFGTTRSGMVA